jgi:hypothetical protein
MLHNFYCIKIANITPGETVTVQTCYSSPSMLLSSLVILEGVADLLVSYDLFLVSGQKKTAFSYIQFE